MLLKNLLHHKKNTNVSVGGEVYPIDGEGKADVTNEEHAEKLLQNDNWSMFDPNAAPP